MSYNVKLPDDLTHRLWELREMHGCLSIAGQIREAVRIYIKRQERRLSKPIIPKVEEENN